MRYKYCPVAGLEALNGKVRYPRVENGKTFYVERPCIFWIVCDNMCADVESEQEEDKEQDLLEQEENDE